MGKLDQMAIEEKIKKGKEKEMKEKRKQAKEKIKKEKVSFLTDFKNFIMKGNVLDLAVAVVISTSFNAIVTGLVKNIITPLITFITSGKSVEELKYVLKAAVEEIAADGTVTVVEPEVAILYGLWFQTIIDFLIIAFSIFVAVRIIKSAERRLKHKELAAQEEAAAKKKEEDAAAAAASAAAIKAEKEALAEFYANVKKQTELLEDISKRIDK